MKIRFLIPVLLVLITVMIAGAQVEPPLMQGDYDPAKHTYVVKRGDTLWDIASRFMASGFRWPLIWQANPHIEDPHWIYPGDVLTIIPYDEASQYDKIAGLPVERMGGGEASAPFEAGEMIRDVPLYTQTSVTFSPSQIIGFMTSKDLETTGVIHAAPLAKTVYGTWDRVYINIGENTGLKPGDIFGIIRPENRVPHPTKNKTYGIQVRTLGKLKIAKVEEKTAEAEIIASNEDIIIGDRLVPVIDVPQTVNFIDVDPSYIGNPLEAIIICSQQGKENFGEGDIVYLDVGEAQNLKPGHLFAVYKPKTTKRDPATRRQELVPEETIGRLVVLVTREDYSSALVIYSTREFMKGELIRTDRFTIDQTGSR